MNIFQLRNEIQTKQLRELIKYLKNQSTANQRNKSLAGAWAIEQHNQPKSGTYTATYDKGNERIHK